MSADAWTWASKFHHMKTDHKIVLLLLANYADEENSAAPDAALLSAESGLGPQDIRRVVSELSSAGLLQISADLVSNRYRLNVESDIRETPLFLRSEGFGQ